jgi:hypothetical protein
MKVWAKSYLFLQGCANLFAMFMWIQIEVSRDDGIKDPYTWFSRSALATISFGLWLIASSLEKRRDE